jgi:ComF family protein
MDALSCALLPASCTLCGYPLPQLSSVPICDACWMEFPVHSGPVCARCGDTVDAAQLRSEPASSALCRACRLAPPSFERAVSFEPYQGHMKEAIHALKYDRLHPAAHALGGMLAEAIAQLAGEAPAEMLVVPVPLHRSKHAQRGFNQARALATHALGFLKKSHPEWQLTLASSTLMRLRATESQAGLTPRMRRMNVRGAFSVSDPSLVKSKHVLVIDDILTTGATARAAAKTLTGAGAASVWVATLARARRVNEFSRRISLHYGDDVDRFPPHERGPVRGDPGLAGTVTADVLQVGSGYSSQDQRSF